MKCVRNAFVQRGKKRESQRGFTLIEFLVAFALATIIMVGAVAILRYMVVQTAANGDKMEAQFEAYYVGFWIGDDVIQAENIRLGNLTGNGFPLIIDGGAVKYELVENMGEHPWQLVRTQSDELGNVTSVVGEYLDPEATMCYQKVEGSETYNVLVLEVSAEVDTAEVSSKYEISPRYGNVIWVQGM